MTHFSMFNLLLTTLSIFYYVSCQGQLKECEPFGLRLNLGLKFYNQTETQMLGIRFNTRAQCPKSYAVIQKPFSQISKLNCQIIPVQFNQYKSYVHKCSVYKLGYGQSFSYMAFGWSGKAEEQPIPFEAKFIKSHLMSNSTEVKLVVLADWGYLRVKAGVYDPLDSAFKLMLDMDQRIDAIYIGGDIAYDLDSFQGLYYEDFIKMLSQVSSRWPLILNTGNHEHLTNQSQMILQSSFEVYGSVQNRLTVIHLPYVSWFMLDPYKIVLKGEDSTQLAEQFQVKLQNLIRQHPDKPIVACSHYPYRCNGNIPDCFDVRQRLSKFFDIMMKYNVALYIGAHYHTYERIYPYYYNQTFLKQESPYRWVQGGQKNYLDNTLLSIVEGIAGNDRQIIMVYPPAEEFTAAYVINNTGFGIMTQRANSLTYDHVISKDPYAAKDHWVILFQKTENTNQNRKEQSMKQINEKPSMKMKENIRRDTFIKAAEE